jgi:hypothetical protein
MEEELKNFTRNVVWSLVERPKKNFIGTKWIFCNKQNEFGVVKRNKARLDAQGFTQVEGLDFGETYAQVARLESISVLIAYAANHDFKLYQMDVKSAVLNGALQELVYVEQPQGFEDPKKPNHVYHLHKTLYGLKQAPRAWYECLKDFLLKNVFVIGKQILHYLLANSMTNYLCAKYMSMTLYSVVLMMNFVKNLQGND